VPVHPEKDPATGHVFAKNGVNGALDATGKLEVLRACASARLARRRLTCVSIAPH
jgi:hypothetical protein